MSKCFFTDEQLMSQLNSMKPEKNISACSIVNLEAAIETEENDVKSCTVKVSDKEKNDGHRDIVESSDEETSDDSSDEEDDVSREEDAIVPDKYLFTDEEFLRQFSGKQREIVEQNLKEINEIKECMTKLDLGEISPVEEPSSFDPTFSAFSYIFNRDLNEAPETTAICLTKDKEEYVEQDLVNR
jgi:hypothetical protein